ESPIEVGTVEVGTKVGTDLRAVRPKASPIEDPNTDGSEIRPYLDQPALEYLISEYKFSPANARALVEHFALQARISTIPTADIFLVEVFREGHVIHYFFHALIGRSANDAL